MQQGEDGHQRQQHNGGELQIVRVDPDVIDAPGPHQRHLEHLLLVAETDPHNGADDKGDANRSQQRRNRGAARELAEHQQVTQQAGNRAEQRPPQARPAASIR